MEARVGFWPRLAAAFIDVIILSVLAFLARGPVESLFAGPVADMLARAAEQAGGKVLPPAMQAMMSFSLAMVLLGPLYGLTEGLLGASPGKFILGQRIVTESGNRAAQPQLIARYGVKQVGTVLSMLAMFLGVKTLEHASNVVGVIYVLGCLLAFGQARQALHDKIVGTAILRKSDLPETVTSTPLGAG
jgi:uncharacterized RDD family membrane protein YckC